MEDPEDPQPNQKLSKKAIEQEILRNIKNRRRAHGIEMQSGIGKASGNYGENRLGTRFQQRGGSPLRSLDKYNQDSSPK